MIAVEVADAEDRVIGRDRAQRVAAENVAVVHIPDARGVVGVTAPQNIGLAVAVEVAGAEDRVIGRDRAQRIAAENIAVVHIPDACGAVGAILPQDVGMAVAVEVVDCVVASRGDDGYPDDLAVCAAVAVGSCDEDRLSAAGGHCGDVIERTQVIVDLTERASDRQA